MIELRPEGRFRNNWLMDGWMDDQDGGGKKVFPEEETE